MGGLARAVFREDEGVKFLSLFTGIGGFDLGFESAGMKCIGQVEIDPNCRKVLRQHWPDTERIEDVRSITKEAFMKKQPLKKLTPEDVVLAIELYQTGSGLQDVAEMFGVTRQSMWDLLRRRIELRSKLRFGEDNHFYRGGSVADDNAQNKLEEAIEKERQQRPDTCENCGATPPPMKNGRTRIQAHHPDYNNPYEVMWLCQKCHHEWHKTNSPIPRRKAGEPADQINLICGGFP